MKPIGWIRMKFEEITKRLTGLSCPVFGIQWNPPEAQRSIARRVVRSLEDRRVLYVPYDVEIADYCTRSVLDIRQMLTKELSELDESSGQLYQSLKAIRTACRHFMDRTQVDDRHPRRHLRHWGDPYDVDSQTFFLALGELRATFGIHLAILATQYGLDIEDHLATILPPPDDDKIFPYLSKP